MKFKIILLIFLSLNFGYSNFPDVQTQVNSITTEEEQNTKFNKPDLSCKDGDTANNCVGTRNASDTFTTLDNEEKAGSLTYSLDKTENGTVIKSIEKDENGNQVEGTIRDLKEINFNDGYRYYLGNSEVTKDEYDKYDGQPFVKYKINNNEVTLNEYKNKKDLSTTTSSSVEYYDNQRMKKEYLKNGKSILRDDYFSSYQQINHYNQTAADDQQNNTTFEIKYYIDNNIKSKYDYNSFKSRKSKSNYNNMLNFFSNDANQNTNSMKTVNNSFLNAEDKGDITNEFGEVKTRKNLYKKHFDYQMDNMNNSYIKEQNPNDDRLNADDTIKTVRTQLKTKWNKHVQDTIKCSISRKLVPSYVCPFLDLNGTTFGGQIQDSVIEKKEECEKGCKETYTCLPKKIEGAVTASVDGENPKEKFNFSPSDLTSENNYKIKVDANNVQSTKEVIITVKGNWAEHYTNKLRDSNGSYLYGVDSDRVYYNVYAKYHESDWVTVMNRQSTPTIKPNEEDSNKNIEFQIKIPFNTVLDSIEIQLFPHQDLDVEELYIDSVEFVYEDSEIWFCPEKQRFNPRVFNCSDGTVKLIDMKDGSQMKICVNNTTKLGPEPTYGAFYSEKSCLNNCVRKKRCEPSYKQFRTSSLNKQNFYKIEVKCFDLSNNSNCSEQLCRDYITENKPVLNEWNLNSKDKMESIVSYGILEDGKVRPKIDLTKETINESSTDEDVRKLEISTEKDSAYLDMLNQQNYNFITSPIGETTLQENAYEKEPFEENERYRWILKPKSEDFDKNLYFYAIVEFDQMFYPKYGVYMIPDSQNGGHMVVANDPLMQIQDKTFMIKKADETFKVFRKIENDYFFLEQEQPIMETDENGEEHPTGETQLRRNWVKTSKGYFNDRIVEYINGKLVDMDGSQNAEYFATINGLDKTKTEYRFNISDRLLPDILNVNGGMIKSQTTLDHGQSMERVYNGEIDESNHGMYKGTIDGMKIYGIYSENPLSYNDIIDKIDNDNDNEKYSIYDVKSAFLYKKSIFGDQEFDTNIKLFKQGNMDKTTIHLKLKPKEKEIGKRGFIFLFLY